MRLQVRPKWLSEHPKLWAKVLALWQHPGAAARAAAQRGHDVHERSEAAMLAKLVLSYVDGHPRELPRVLDLFTLFDHPVRCLKRIARSAEVCQGITTLVLAAVIVTLPL
jgi:hypothetical protein